MDASDLLAAYAWAQDSDDRLMAFAITAVRPADGSAIERLRPRSRIEHVMTTEEASDVAGEMKDFGWGSNVVQTDRLGDWDLLIEPNGWLGSVPEVLAALSRGGVAVGIYWNVNALMTVGAARDGVVMRQFDPLLYDHPEHPLPEEGDLPFGEVPAPLHAAMFAFLERVTGHRITRDWLLGRRRATYVVPLDQ